MHWFWRAAIAVVAGPAILGVMFVGASVPPGLIRWNPPGSLPRAGLSDVLGVMMIGVTTSVLSLAAYAILTRRYGPKVFTDEETRCRKCHYILKGISEPRCPECGERI